MNQVDLAIIVHTANKALCEIQGDMSQPDWKDAPQWQRKSAINGVRFHLENPGSSPSDSHESWLDEKTRDGWKYGPVKDPEKKEHPCFVPYDELPESQQIKDYLFSGIIDSLSKFVKDK